MKTNPALTLVAVTCLALCCIVGVSSVQINVTVAAGAAQAYLIHVGTVVSLACDAESLAYTGSYSWKWSSGDNSCASNYAGSTTKNVSFTVSTANVTCFMCWFSYTDTSGSQHTRASPAVSFYPYELATATPTSFDLATVASVNATCRFKTLSPLVNASFMWTRASTGSAALTGSTSTATDSTLVIANSTSAGDVYTCYGVVNDGMSTVSAAANGIVGVNLATYTVTSPPYAEVYAFDKEQYTEGDKVNVTCKALGYPTPKVTWLREGATVNTSQQTVAIAGGLNVSFTIGCLRPDADRGAYVCVATSTVNASSSRAYASAPKTLHARSKLAPLWPAIGILVQLAVVAVVIAVTEHFRAKRAAAAVGKGGARLDGSKKSAEAVDGGGSSSNNAVTGVSYKA